jgi:hypothetical protein
MNKHDLKMQNIDIKILFRNFFDREIETTTNSTAC